MKRISIVCLLCLPLCLLDAQMTTINQSSERKYEDGVNLYEQQHYAASERMLEEYLQSSAQPKHKELAEYYLAANAFCLRQKDAMQQLEAYLTKYPYSTYVSEVHFMLGTLQLEKGKFKQAVKQFEMVEASDISRDHQPELLFSRGYALLEMNEPQKASIYFGKLKNQESLYKKQAQYYYSYCQYAIGNYGKALPGFLSLETSELYKDVVPYYIVQIYYAQKQYDEVYARAERLLAYEKDSENSGELHRMLGEIYYQQGKYDKSIEHLLAYQEIYSKQKKQLLREDIYLLGMANYQMGDYEKSVLWLKKVKQEKDEITQNVLMHEGNAYLKLGHVELAKMAYQAAMSYDFDKQAKEEATYNYAITTYQSSSALGESVKAFTDFLNQYPNSKHTEEVYSLLTDVFLSSKNYSAAYDALSQISNPNKQLLETKQYLLYQMGVEAYLQGKREQAINNFTALINNEKGTTTYKTESYFWRAESRYGLRDFDGAQQDLTLFEKQKNATKSSNYQLSQYLKGYVLFSKKNYKEAQKAFSKYITKTEQTDATYADAMNRIGDCYFSDKQFSQAENCYAKVVSLGGAGADYALFQRGLSLGLLKRYNDKINTLEKLVKQYPRSDYADDALYEIARTELLRENPKSAIDAYEKLLANYPNSNMARKAALERAMTYFNIEDYDKAIEAYKAVIKTYPQSEEAYMALDGLQAAYIETNNISAYLDYTKTLGKLKMKVSSREDSLVYASAERQYMLGNYEEAIVGFTSYITKYCDGSRYCTVSQYYLADSYYRTNKRNEALAEYKKLCSMGSSPYLEEACLRVAEITYDAEEWETSRSYFEKLQKCSSSTEHTNIALLGILRCSYLLDDTETTLKIATQLIDDQNTAADVRREALYNRGKAFYELHQYDLALSDLEILSDDVKTSVGAEAKYLVAQIYFDIKEIDIAEAQAMDFIKKSTPYQYWLARCFVLLSDIYKERGDMFAAKQYLISLQNNYKANDDIKDIIASRLAELEQLPTDND